eukprot:13308920-Ditylum_brightwellii.AAC.1
MASEINNKYCRCTCGPYPEIDLTEGYIHFTREKRVGDDDDDNDDDDTMGARHDEEKWIVETREQVLHACQQYGCFHVSINVSCGSIGMLSSLRGDVQKEGSDSSSKSNISRKLEDAIEELFGEEFLQRVAPKSSSLPNGLQREGGQLPETFDARVPPPSCYRGNDVKGSTMPWVDATFRGRSSESGDGDAQAAKSEPKQSWEFRRCR